MTTYRCFTLDDMRKAYVETSNRPIPMRGIEITVSDFTRSKAQNALMWALLSKFVEQGASINGRQFDAHGRKAFLCRGLQVQSPHYS